MSTFAPPGTPCWNNPVDYHAGRAPDGRTVHDWNSARPVRCVPPGPLALGDTSTLGYIWSAASVAGCAVGAYHGYVRNRGSIGWALWWAFMGSLAPVIVLPVAYAQGIGKVPR